MKRPRQSAARQNAGPLALFGFVVNVTASFFRQFSRHISTWEKELNRRRQTLKPLENQGFFRLSLLYRNGIPTPPFSLSRAFLPFWWPSGWGMRKSRPRSAPMPTSTLTNSGSWWTHSPSGKAVTLLLHRRTDRSLSPLRCSSFPKAVIVTTHNEYLLKNCGGPMPSGLCRPQSILCRRGQMVQRQKKAWSAPVSTPRQWLAY